MPWKAGVSRLLLTGIVAANAPYNQLRAIYRIFAGITGPPSTATSSLQATARDIADARQLINTLTVLKFFIMLQRLILTFMNHIY